MEPWHAAHLAFLVAWAISVLAEFALESGASVPVATRAHFWIDVVFEVPVIVGVLVSGAVLVARAWPPTAVLVAKIGFALAAIGLNLYCAAVVILRYRARGHVDAVARYGRKVRLSALGLPFGLVAGYIGLTHFL